MNKVYNTQEEIASEMKDFLLNEVTIRYYSAINK